MKQLQFLLSLLVLISCGADNGAGTQASAQMPDTLPVEGKYRAVIRPINTPASGIASGMADFEITNDELTVKLVMDEAPRVTHPQAVHSGTECPINADLNDDGYVDAKEAINKSGEVLFYLDDKINPILPTAGFPRGGSYTYIQSTGRTKLEEILKEKGMMLDLVGKVILVHGVTTNTTLPSTAGEHASLPIACGIVQRTE
jgi:hypothetical protein